MRTLVLLALLPALPACAQPAFTTIYAFLGGSGGKWPAYLSAAPDGKLYGITAEGGAGTDCRNGCGLVFSLAPPAAPGGEWTETVLYNFADPVNGHA